MLPVSSNKRDIKVDKSQSDSSDLHTEAKLSCSKIFDGWDQAEKEDQERMVELHVKSMMAMNKYRATIKREGRKGARAISHLRLYIAAMQDAKKHAQLCSLMGGQPVAMQIDGTKDEPGEVVKMAKQVRTLDAFFGVSKRVLPMEEDGSSGVDAKPKKKRITNVKAPPEPSRLPIEVFKGNLPIYLDSSDDDIEFIGTAVQGKMPGRK